MKDEAFERVEDEKRLFRSRLSYTELRQLIASCESLPRNFSDRKMEFHVMLLQFMVETFTQMGDRDSLVGLLSQRFVALIDGRCIESYLTYRENAYLDIRGNKLKDGILVLGEAYAKCRVQEVREDIAFAVRRAFAGLGVEAKEDGEFVSKAMQWYREKKGRLVRHPEYGANDLYAPPEIHYRNPEAYQRVLAEIPGGRRPLFLEQARPSMQCQKLRGAVTLWLAHTGIACVLLTPIVLLGRTRARWRLWELLGLALPIGLWMLLMVSQFAVGRKAPGNLNEAMGLAFVVPAAAIARVAVGPRVSTRACAAATLAVLCAVAIAVFFLVPPLFIFE